MESWRQFKAGANLLDDPGNGALKRRNPFYLFRLTVGNIKDAPRCRGQLDRSGFPSCFPPIRNIGNLQGIHLKYSSRQRI